MKVYHWWPGRQYAGPCPIPRHYVEKAEKMGSRYLTYAKQELGMPGRWAEGWAFCCPKDFPSRKLGREIAIGRLLAGLRNYVPIDDALSS